MGSVLMCAPVTLDGKMRAYHDERRAPSSLKRKTLPVAKSEPEAFRPSIIRAWP